MPGAKTQTNGAGCFLWHGKYLSKILSEKITCSVVKKFPWIWSDFLPSSLFLGVTDMMSVDWCVFERDFFPRSTFSSSACLSAAKKCLGSQSSEWWISDVSSINRTVYSLFSSDLLRKLCRKSPVLMAWGFEANWKWDRERAFICRWQRKGEEEKKRPVSGRAMGGERALKVLWKKRKEGRKCWRKWFNGRENIWVQGKMQTTFHQILMKSQNSEVSELKKPKAGLICFWVHVQDFIYL